MADEGKDLVCAGCSTCFIGALNAIQDIDNFKVKVDKGLGFVEAKKNISNHDKIVLGVLLVEEAKQALPLPPLPPFTAKYFFPSSFK